MPALRLALDATPLLGARTGIGRYVDRMLANLPQAAADRGLDADIRVTTWTWRGSALRDLPDGVRQVGRRAPARLLRAGWRHVSWPPVERLSGPCDVFHGTNFVSPPTRRAAEVVTVHDLTFDRLPSTVSRSSLAYGPLVAKALARGATVLVPTDAVGSELAERYDVDPARIVTSHLGVDDDWFDSPPVDTTWLARRELPSDYIVFVGSLDPRKNLRRLLDAYARLRTYRRDAPGLVLAGPAGREPDLADADGVHLTGWLDDDELRSLVTSSRALLLPSLDEGFGLPALEALAAGRPVMVADVPALREVTGPHAVTADPLDVDSLADGLDRVLRVADNAPDRSARQAWARTFSWASCAHRTLDAYQLALS